MKADLVFEMVNYFSGDARRINHFLKVHAFARAIAEREGLEEKKREIIEVAALVHDIGIKISEEKYGSRAASI